eukprot:gene50932-1263_t
MQLGDPQKLHGFLSTLPATIRVELSDPPQSAAGGGAAAAFATG